MGNAAHYEEHARQLDLVELDGFDNGPRALQEHEEAMKKKVLFVFLACLVMCPALAAGKSSSVKGRNSQTVSIKGGIVNKADSGGLARVNIGSVVGSNVGGNTQSVQTSGAIVNEAKGGGKAEVNIGSVVEGQR